MMAEGVKRHTLETRRKISVSMRGKHHTEESKRRMFTNSARRDKPGTMLGKHHTEETRMKLSEANLGKIGSFLGRNHTLETRRKISEAHLGKKLGPMSEEAKRKLSEANLGRKRGPMSKEHKRKISESLRENPGWTRGMKHSEETKRKIRENHRGGPRRCFYKDIWFRSSWEAKVVEYLDKRSILWLYEPHVFTLVIDNKETTYRPDFYLPEFNVYYEVKGYTRPGLNNYAKVLAAREQHNLNITVIDYGLLRRLGVL